MGQGDVLAGTYILTVTVIMSNLSLVLEMCCQKYFIFNTSPDLIVEYTFLYPRIPGLARHIG